MYVSKHFKYEYKVKAYSINSRYVANYHPIQGCHQVTNTIFNSSLLTYDYLKNQLELRQVATIFSSLAQPTQPRRDQLLSKDNKHSHNKYDILNQN